MERVNGMDLDQIFHNGISTLCLKLRLAVVTNQES